MSKRTAKRHGAAQEEKQAQDGWHLARSAEEQAMVQLEFGMEQLIHAYYRWKVNCLSTLGDFGLTGDDITILNIIRMGDSPKKMIEIARILNRTDLSNMQYATRKLIKAGLVEKVTAPSRRDTTYRASAYGVEVTDHYAATRRKLVIDHLADKAPTPDQVSDVGAVFDTLIQIYEQGTRRAIAETARLGQVSGS